MNVLLLGSGAREHAIAWKLTQSKRLTKLYVAPGNAGIAQLAQTVDISATDFVQLSHFCLNNSVQMIVVGPEAPLVEGITDYFKQNEATKHIHIIGPDKQGAALEGSKDFAKEFMLRHQIPTARYQTFTQDKLADGIKFLSTLTPPYVLKADGLAAGKGVIITSDLTEAQNTLTEMLGGMFGKASHKVVIEEFLQGIELSVFALLDGNGYVMLPEAKDYKRIGEADTGLNTGGMGSISPVPFANKEFMQKVEDRVIKKTVEGLRKENIHYCGFIFAGLMNVKGEPYVIEYNVRLGDPETESVMPRIENDLLDVFEAAATQSLHSISIHTKKETAATVMLVSQGYPGNYTNGKQIEIPTEHNSYIFHAGTKQDNNQIVSNGGRVIAVCSLGENKDKALEISYQTISKLKFDGMYFRRDIGFDL